MGLFNSKQPPPRRPRIDRSMIGQPTNFQHTGHIGSGDTGAAGTMKSQMQSKGGHGDAGHGGPAVVNALPIEEAQKRFGGGVGS